VQRWREEKRQHGLKAVTVWLTQEEELRLKELALQWYCSPSALVQQALAQFSPQTPPGIGTATDVSQIRELTKEELVARHAEVAFVTDTVTEVVTDTLAQDLPGLVREIIEGMALGALGLPVTDTNGSDTDTDGDITDANSGVTDTEPPGEAPPPQPSPRKRGEMRQRILTLLGEHPEGLSAEQIRVYLKAEKPLGNTLQGMRRAHVVTTCVFHGKAATDSRGSLPLIPRQSCRRFHGKAAADSRGRLPPLRWLRHPVRRWGTHQYPALFSHREGGADACTEGSHASSP
jgi:hypothetical protein